MSEVQNQQVYPDVAAVRAAARRAWEKQARKTISIQERIGGSVSWWLIVVALVFFALSAPHTAAVFAMLTPVFGYAAPFGIEFGQLYTAFRRKLLKMKKPNDRVPAGDLALEILLFITSVIVNGAGSFRAVISMTESVEGLSMAALVREFPMLPASSQIALVLVPMAALIIPIGAVVAGAGLASLFLERRESGNLLDEQWKEAQPEIEFYALRDAAIRLGVQPKAAIRWASQITGWGQLTVVSSVSAVSAGNHRTEADGHRTIAAMPNGHGTGQGYEKQMDARQRVRMHLDENPGDLVLSARMLAAKVGIGKTVASEVIAEYKAKRDGHGEG